MSDLISKELFDQIKWERDIAIGQLKELGYGLGEKIRTDKDTISRHAAIDAFLTELTKRERKNLLHTWSTVEVKYFITDMLERLPSAQPECDIPMKPNETIDSSWGIRKKQAVCPKCDYYLGHVEFIGNPNGKKVTYCETCGQAIDWEGWRWKDDA